MTTINIFPVIRSQTVIMTSKQYASLTDDHLSDKSTYQRITNDPTTSQEQKINDLWKEASSRTTLTFFVVKKLTTHHSRILNFIICPTHKQHLSARPVVLAINSPCEKMAWLFPQLLLLFLTDMCAHLENTHQLISKLSSVPSARRQ